MSHSATKSAPTHRILVINPGSTSTKIAVFDDDDCVLSRNIRHSVEELSAYLHIPDQLPFRLDHVLSSLQEANVSLCFSAVIARGGLIKPVPGGIYCINEQMLKDIVRPIRTHACNLGALIAYHVASLCNHCPAYIVDPALVDELDDVARLTGHPLIVRQPIWHALNQRAIARRLAAELGGRYEDFNFIGCHLGGGISIAAHRKGRAVEANNALDGEGPFSPERAGTLPAGDWLDVCTSGEYDTKELKRSLAGRGGLYALMGTTDVEDILRRADEGNQRARLVIDAMIYQTARHIGAAATALYGQVDTVFLTGGIAHSHYITEQLTARVRFIAPVHVFPGEDEMLALAQNALDVLRGKAEAKPYQ